MAKNNNFYKNAIIVSGIPRTATTIVGKIISELASYSTIYEPFNSNQGLTSVNLNYLLPGSNISIKDFDLIFENLLELKGEFKQGLNDNDTFLKKIFKKIIGNESSISFKKAKYFKKKGILIKDPFLLFAAEYLSNNYNIIICERPLLPLAGSFKRMSWIFHENNRLLNDLSYLDSKFLENDFEIEKIITKNISLSVIGAVKFFSIYSIFKKYLKQKNNIYFFKQDKLSTDPSQSITSLLSWLKIDFSEQDIFITKNKISSSFSKNSKPKQGIQHDKNYNKKYANKYYESLLSKDEIRFIKVSEKIICSGGEI
tara:strand:- start:127 stop:1065 length:939 start_codon:yes stop_codon:yes gene_type:complete